MIVVIIAGGSGTRLWPLSTPSYPKHLLTVNGSDKSLVQNTYERAKKIGDSVYVLTEASHADHVKEQLPDLPDDAFIIEPARRGTASCIIAGLERIARNHKPDEPIAFLAADHYIRDVEGFRHSFGVAGKVSTEKNKIVLVGAEPDYPATGFGYIQKGKVLNKMQSVFEVDAFKEKPDYDTARAYLRSGQYLWNCGYFVASLDTFLQSMEHYAPELKTNFERLRGAVDSSMYEKTYLGFENNSIDYALIEKVKGLLVVPATFDWMDLGSFADLAKVVDSDERGNHVHGDRIETEEVESAFIQNYEDKPVAVIGLDNVVVINSPNGVLVVRKDLSQKVGEVSKRIQK
jgi:mannose-1-phosphate guanylyltransferase/mannose-6-phosphate isomerase